MLMYTEYVFAVLQHGVPGSTDQKAMCLQQKIESILRRQRGPRLQPVQQESKQDLKRKI